MGFIIGYAELKANNMTEIERIARAIDAEDNKHEESIIEWIKKCIKDDKMYKKPEGISPAEKRMLRAQAALNASSAKLVPGLVEALEDIKRQSSFPFTAEWNNYMREIANKALAEYRKWQQGK